MLRGTAAAVSLLVGLAAAFAALADAPLGEPEARKAAVRFGQALMRDDSGSFESLLPRQGTVRVRLGCLGPEHGSFSAGQVEALLRDFLRHGAVRSFAIVRSEADDDRYALVHGAADVIDRDGAPHQIHLHLTFQPEDGRWILREIRETPP